MLFIPCLTLACAAANTMTADAGDALAIADSDVAAPDAADTARSDAPDNVRSDAVLDADPCPTAEQAAFVRGTGCAPDGRRCTYGYTRPECGGRTLTCVAGAWNEEHSDPTTACFSDGGTPGPIDCAGRTCAPSEFCVHQCSGIDLGEDSPSRVPACGTPASCFGGSGHANGRDWYCTGCV